MRFYEWLSPARSIAAQRRPWPIAWARAAIARYRDRRAEGQLERAWRRNGLSVLLVDEFPAPQRPRSGGRRG